MLFYVQAEDAPDVQDRMIAQGEAHWSYMDRFADRLVLRGPTLSEDGEEHTGSVHVVEVADRAAAERFATREPYWISGLYREFTADRIIVREQGGISRDEDATLVTARWSARPLDATEPKPPQGALGFFGLLVDDEGVRSTGCVAVVRTLVDKEVQVVVDEIAGEGVTVTARRWCRGGRS
ncbi:YciI family protein [Streptomyces mesophilus]|uniref:YciI family protein n=1 Tax=Streptomyces mesophilus TaxID=1775132 RepID=UPI00331A92FB